MHLSGQFKAVHTGDKGSSMGELRRVSLLETTAELEAFKHSVSTDLVNHLITVQKVLIQVWTYEKRFFFSGGGVQHG